MEYVVWWISGLSIWLFERNRTVCMARIDCIELKDDQMRERMRPRFMSTAMLPQHDLLLENIMPDYVGIKLNRYLDDCEFR